MGTMVAAVVSFPSKSRRARCTPSQPRDVMMETLLRVAAGGQLARGKKVRVGDQVVHVEVSDVFFWRRWIWFVSEVRRNYVVCWIIGEQDSVPSFEQDEESRLRDVMERKATIPEWKIGVFVELSPQFVAGKILLFPDAKTFPAKSQLLRQVKTRPSTGNSLRPHWV